jgi:hypothetical protein
MYVFVTKIIILVVVILPLLIALGPCQGQRDQKKLIGQKNFVFSLITKLEKKNTHTPFLKKEIAKRTTTKQGATSVTLKSRQALNTVQ